MDQYQPNLKEMFLCWSSLKLFKDLKALLQMSFTDKLFHLQFIPILDQVFTFIRSSICYYTIIKVIDLGPFLPIC